MTTDQICFVLAIVLVAVILNGCVALEVSSLFCSATQGKPCSVSLREQE